MPAFSPSIDLLIENLCGLPGIGSRTAQRLALYLLANNRPLGEKITESLRLALLNIKECDNCRNFAEAKLCVICENPSRNNQICIVESALDILAIESSNSYKGYYFLLHGHLSPLDNIGPEQLRLDKLDKMIKAINCEEVILATNPTVEGEITAHYIKQHLAPAKLKITRIAHGVPLGGELEYIDSNTLALALSGRTPYQEPPHDN